MYDKNEKYGFETVRKITMLKAYPEDSVAISNLYATESKLNGIQKIKIEKYWETALNKERRDFDNCNYVLRDNCGKIIGLVGSETKDRKNFRFCIWIPNWAKRARWQEHILDSLVEFVENYTDIWKIEEILLVEDIYHMTGQTLGKDYNFVEVA